jgi:hypothetical protein
MWVWVAVLAKTARFEQRTGREILPSAVLVTNRPFLASNCLRIRSDSPLHLILSSRDCIIFIWLC